MGLSAAPQACRRRVSGLAQPEDVFLSWLLAQPPGADLAAAADAEIRRLDRYEGPHPGPRRLVELFETLRGSATGAGERPG